jgi:hypothetical protein
MRGVLLAVCFAGLAVGCSSDPGRMPDTTEISGTVVTADGKPVKDVMLSLRPKGAGTQAGCALSADGKFTVKAVPGEFMFLFMPLEDPKADKAKVKAGMAAVPAKYQDVSVDHVVTLKAGGGNEIKLQ